MNHIIVYLLCSLGYSINAALQLLSAGVIRGIGTGDEAVESCRIITLCLSDVDYQYLVVWDQPGLHGLIGDVYTLPSR